MIVRGRWLFSNPVTNNVDNYVEILSITKIIKSNLAPQIHSQKLFYLFVDGRFYKAYKHT